MGEPSSLLFADDSLIFISASEQSAGRLNLILQIYADCSGQSVNKKKSSVYLPLIPLTFSVLE